MCKEVIIDVRENDEFNKARFPTYQCKNIEEFYKLTGGYTYLKIVCGDEEC